MKKLLLLFLMFTTVYSVDAQINTPQLSPNSVIEQKVGLTDVTLKFSRPSMRGRTVFGDLVPYDKMWRTGANKNTVITFGEDVEVAGKPVKAGSYAIFTKPGKDTWDVYLYADTENWGTPREWDDSKVVTMAQLPVVKMPMKIETFTMSFDDLKRNGAVLGIMWENVYVGLEFNVPTDETVIAAIDRVMGTPTANDYYSAAVYYAEAGKDINKSKEWMEKAMSMIDNPRFWQLRQQSLIYAKAGDKKLAIEVAKKSLAESLKAENDSYVKMNMDSLKEWGAM